LLDEHKNTIDEEDENEDETGNVSETNHHSPNLLRLQASE
jgi:hypothetical protein